MKKILTFALVGLMVLGAQCCLEGQLKINGICQPVSYIAGCVQYASGSSCNICEYGYQIADGRCEYSEKPTSQCCILSDSNGMCLQCAPGLYKDGNSCFKIQRPGCLQGTGRLCTNCANGYQNINGRCYRKIQYCTKYNQKGVCTQCQSGNQLVRGLCTAVLSTQLPPNCRASNEYGCVSCNNGFYLNRNRQCSTNGLGCIKYYRQQCQLCTNGFKLINNKCMMDGCSQYSTQGCVSCVSPYSLVDGRCVIDNCVQSRDGLCTVCSSDYRIKNGRCVKPIADRCSNCANGYFVGQDGKCYKKILGCSQYRADGRCNLCVQPYTLNGGSCVIQGCERLTDKGCQLCYRPFMVSSIGRCYLQYCLEYNYQIRKCKSCKVGYHVQSGLCVKNDPLCKSYTLKGDSQVCSACTNPESYVLTQSGECLSRKPGCVYQYGKCISCAYPFKKSTSTADNTIQCVIEGCSKYDYDGCLQCSSPYQQRRGICVVPYCQQVQDGKCTRCSSGYHLIRRGLCIEDDARCAAYTDQLCTKCINGYKFNRQGNCVRDIPYCSTYGYQQCEQCQAGYQLTGGRCIISDRYCQVYDKLASGCSKCVSNYHTQFGVCKYNDPSCATYSLPAYTQRCTKCINGFVFASDQSGRCVKQSPGCIYDSTGACSSCIKPFVYKAGACIIRGCNKYTQTGCYQCMDPFTRDADSCTISFCDVYDDATLVCKICFNGYKLLQGKCYRQDPKCVQYSQMGVCKACISQYTLFENVCVKTDKYCSKYSKQGGCNKCKDRYYLSVDGICLPEQPGCIYQNGKCTLCNYPFKFNEVAQKCRIQGCNQADATGCTKCKYPFERQENSGLCVIANCVAVQDNHCVRCSPGYHLKQGMTCVKNDPSCLKYNEDGDCQRCDTGYMLMSSGQCQIAQDNCIEKKKAGQCTACKDQYFLNKFYQCQKKDKYCEQYNNGVCVRCDNRHFLWELICFPYSPGCVSYKGKDCTACKKSWFLRNGECFNLKTPSLKLQGNDQKYDFEITPIDITKSKYYIDNLSPISKLAKVFYSSFMIQYTDARLISEQQNIYTKGWKAEKARDNEYIGYIIQDSDPVTFYAIQIQGVQGNYIRSFYIQYSVDGVNYIRIDKLFDSDKAGKSLSTIYFTGVYAKAIRIVIKSYYGWPAARIEFFYYDTLRFRKISNLKSLKYLKQSIQSNFIDRMDNQMYINQRNFFNPTKSCINPDVCFTGLQLCQPRTIQSMTLSSTSGTISKVYITYSLDGRSFNCYEKCRQIALSGSSNMITLNRLLAKNVRVYPVQWVGTPSLQCTYDYA